MDWTELRQLVCAPVKQLSVFELPVDVDGEQTLCLIFATVEFRPSMDWWLIFPSETEALFLIGWT
jgi:hypothetical protein